MKLRHKLMVAPAIAGVTMLITLGASVGILAYYKSASNQAHTAVLAGYSKAAQIQSRLGHQHAQLYRSIAIIGSMEDAAVKNTRQQFSDRLKAIETELTEISATAKNPEVAEQLKTLVGILEKYRQAGDSAIDMASVDANTGVAAVQSAEGNFNLVNQSIDAILSKVQAQSVAIDEKLTNTAQWASIFLVALGLLAAAASVFYSWVTQRRVVANITRGAEAAAKVAQCQLTSQPTSSDKDELGDLLRALGSMVGQLRDSIVSVREAAESIGTASSEIAVGNQDLSQRTEQTASNLQQAASSMEQLTGTVRQSADAARQANQLATSAAEVAQRGGEVVSQVVSTMDEINASSKKISDIIGVIDGIAFQTNILALNAAVEAARAGEQGRGFAVVASEVRSLAGRSAEAAREIKALIGASVERVEAGSRLVADAGQTMNEIVGSVQRVSDIIGEITAAASEQSEGIGSVSGSVTHLDQMTQQNAALVEQSAAAAESLKDQASRLRAVVGKFQLGS